MFFKFVLGQRNVLLTQEVLRAKHERTKRISEEVFVDDKIGSCAGIKVMGESPAECLVVYARPQSKRLPLNLGPLLAAPVTDGFRPQHKEAGRLLPFVYFFLYGMDVCICVW